MDRPTPTIRPPRWARGEHPRVLVEAAEWAQGAATVSALTEAGMHAASCFGPEGWDLSCPLVDEDGCSAAAECDVIVYLLRVTDARNLGVLRRMRERFPETPVILCAPAPALARLDPPLDERVVVLDYPASLDEIVEAVDGVLRDMDVSPP